MGHALKTISVHPIARSPVISSLSAILFFSLLFFFPCSVVYALENKDPEKPPHSTIDSVLQLTDLEESWLKAHPTIRVSGPGAFPPFRYFEKDGTLRGMAWEYTRFLAELLGIELVYEKKIPWPEVLRKTKAKEIDLLSCVARTRERETYLTFSQPFLSFPLVIITRKDAPFIGGLKDLYGKKTALIRGISTGEWLKRDDINVIPYPVSSPLEALKAVSSAHAEAYIGNLASVTYQIEKYGLANLKIAAPTPYGNYNLFFAARKDWPLLVTLINKALTAMTSENHANIRNKWLSPVRYEHGISKTDVLRWILGILGGTALAFFIMFLWNRRLKREITVREKAEKALRQSEQRYRTLFENSPISLWEEDFSDVITHIDQLRRTGITDFKAYFDTHPHDLRHCSSLVKILNVNRTTLQLYGAENKEVFLKGLPIIFTDESLGAFKMELDALAKGKTECEVECINQTLRGERLLLKMRWAVAPGHEKTYAKILVSLIDFTETRQAELALRESEKRHRIVVENASEAIFIAQDDIIKFSNSKAQELSGYSKEALTKMPFIEMVHPMDRAMVLDRHRKRLDGDKIPEIYSFRLLSRDQRELWVDLNVVRIEWEGKPATLNFLRDMTDKKRLEKRLQQTQRMESIGTLAGGIAHDFNNILGVIVGNTELAMEELPQWNPAYRNLEQTRKACHRAVDMVKQILSFSRRSRSELMPINITPVVKESLQLLRASTPASIEIIRNIAGDIQTILADPTQIHQVIINICTNAIHAMADESGTIQIVLKNVQIDAHMAAQNPDLTPGNHVRLHVSDTGCGMDPETLNRMFEPYFTTKDVGKGTGMGLYVVLGIVRGHHGAISVQSEPGKGTVFDIFFPVVSKEAVAEPETDEAVPQGHEQVLIVDDEASLLITCREMLEKLGYGVNACADPLEALEQFKQNPAQIDLVITDMTMPRMTGEKLGQELLKIRPDLPIIIATGYSKRINEESALEMGFKGLIMKPLDRRNLAKAIREALD